jgi:two-component system response regulator DegU
MSSIRVLVADDQEIYREMMLSTLAEEDDLEVVGEASNGEEAIEKCRQLGPDIILLDINMPKMNGIQATKTIVETCPATKVVILSAFDDDQYVLQLARVGAKGYILKESHPREVLRAIRTAYTNDSLWEPKIQNKILREMGRLLEERDRQTDPENKEERLRDKNFDTLTEREREVLRLMGRGQNNREIGETLHISEPTVKTHVSNVMQKMGFRDRVEAALFASRAHGAGERRR